MFSLLSEMATVPMDRCSYKIDDCHEYEGISQKIWRFQMSDLYVSFFVYSSNEGSGAVEVLLDRMGRWREHLKLGSSMRPMRPSIFKPRL